MTISGKNLNRGLFTFLGGLSLILGMAGIVLPLLPTTPFLLLSAACFARSNQKFYNWIIFHPVWGKYIRNYREKKGITLRTKIVSLSVLWITILTSCIWGTDKTIVRIILPIIAFLVTIHLLRFKTLRD